MIDPVQLHEWIEAYNPDAMTADGFDAAIIGITEQCGERPALVVYDVEMCLAILMARDGMDYAEAYEFFDLNIAAAWINEHTPLFVNRIPPDIMREN